MTYSQHPLRHSILSDSDRDTVAAALQGELGHPDRSNAAASNKRTGTSLAHSSRLSTKSWTKFWKPSDEASDDIAERMVTLGSTADGRSATVTANSKIEDYPAGFHGTVPTLTLIAAALHTTIQGMRSSIEIVGEVDPITEDLLIGASAELEKHLWMLQAQITE